MIGPRPTCPRCKAKVLLRCGCGAPLRFKLPRFVVMGKARRMVPECSADEMHAMTADSQREERCLCGFHLRPSSS